MKLTTITQQIVFKNVKAPLLYGLYTDQTKHAAVTGAPATISDKLGEPFNLYGGFCFGENIEIRKDKLIIQSWRTDNWPDDTDDSIVIIRLAEEGADTILYLTHADLPAEMAVSLANGWNEFYWNKWQTHVAQIKQSVHN